MLGCRVVFAGVISLALSVSVGATTAHAVDYFLTIGGGYSPSGNQASLEKNVLFFQALLKERKLADAPHAIFFADGNHVGRDLQFVDPKYDIPKANRLLARVMRQERFLGYQYRSHAVPGIKGADNPQNIKRWFQEVGRKLTKNDRLVIYLTGHGGKGDKKTPGNTKFYMWNSKSMKASEFTGLLDKVPAEVPVAMVMVQCYSGGFANVIFNQASAKKGVTGANRCGFYATVQTRPAAGCTADINEADYQEYSSFFWAALRGKTRVGKAIKRPDYDGDGVVSFDEAHAFAVIASDTIDIPVKTSDALLRHASKTKVKGRKDLVTAETKYGELLKTASKSERAILEQLSKLLKLSGDNRAKAARGAAGKIAKQKKGIEAKLKKTSGERDAAGKAIRSALFVRWPELSNRWNPQVGELLGRQSNEVVRLIESHKHYSAFTRKYDEAKKLAAQKLDLDRRWVKTQRVLRTLENVALAVNLPKLADAKMQARYRRLLESERQTLGGVVSGR